MEMLFSLCIFITISFIFSFSHVMALNVFSQQRSVNFFCFQMYGTPLLQQKNGTKAKIRNIFV